MNVIVQQGRDASSVTRDAGWGLPISRTIYRFGAIDAGHFGHLALAPEGRVAHYRNSNESRYEFNGAVLTFINATGAATSRLRYFADANCFFADDKSRLYLLPVLELAEPEVAPRLAGPVLINSIPKSGTYFIEAMLQRIGGVPVRVHLSANACHDYRGMSEAEMHRKPVLQLVTAPGGAVAHILRPGDVAVGHLDDPAALQDFITAGVTVLHCVRDLRDVLVSLYRFKKAKVEPFSPQDAEWRQLDDTEGFLAFLNLYAGSDIRHIADMAVIILNREEPVLRFEEAIRGVLPDPVREALNRLGLATDAAEQALRIVRDKPTSTYSGRHIHYGRFWSEAAETFFTGSGLAALNQRLGYLL